MKPAEALELRALQALGIAAAPPAAGPGEGVLDALVRAGALARHQALAARAWVERHAVKCRCGERWLAGESCPTCGTRVGSAPPAPEASAGESGRRRSALAPGARVGPLLVQEELGRGAAGVVYRALHEGLQRECALKVVPGATREERRRRRFANEVEALARLAHPGIVKVHAVHELPDALALEMELVRGRDLDELVRAEGPLPWREAARLVAELAHAVHHAHQLDVLHRDLKPENVLVRDGDRSGVVADFGLTRLSDQASSLTVAGALLGTPLYMAPEAFQGEFTPRTDVYGLGAILYQALSGRAPFQADSAASLQYKITTGQVEPLRGAGLPPELERIRARAMHVEPTRRYGSAAELAGDLERVLRGERASVSRAGWTALGAGHGLPLLVGLLLLLGLVGGGALLLARSVAPAEPAPPAPGSGLEAALRTLGTAAAEPRRRESALLRARAACAPRHPEHAELVAGLEPALAAAEEPGPLRLVRLLLDRAEARPLRADDLSAAVPWLEPADVEAVALAALEQGTLPPFASPEAAAAARALVQGHREARAPRALLGVALCAGGDPGARPEAASLLNDPPPPPGAARAVALAGLLRDADALAEQVEAGGDPVTDDEALARRIEAVRADPELARAPAVVLARVARAVPLGIANGRLVDFTRFRLAESVTRALHAGRPALTPSQRALEVLVEDLLDEDPPWWVRPRGEELRAWGQALGAEEPLLGLAAEQLGLRVRIEREGPHGAEECRRLYGLEEELLARLASFPPPRTDAEGAVQARTLHRASADKTGLEQRLAQIAPDAPTREAHLRRALELARETLEITDRYGLSWRKVLDVQLVLQLAFATGELEAAEAVRLRSEQAVAVEVELLRRRGQPGAARDRARAALEGGEVLPARGTSDLLGALCLAQADLGELEAARATLARLQASLGGEDPDVLLDPWTPAALEPSLAARAAREQ